MFNIFNTLSFVTLCVVIGYTLGTGLTLCKNAEENVLEGNKWIKVPAENGTAVVRTVRFPEKGKYGSKINCLTVFDRRNDNNNVPEILEGGLGKKIVEIRVTSPIGKPMEYLVYVYSNNVTAPHVPYP